MRVLDVSFSMPEENLALDEVLLDEVESGGTDEVLRFWESPGYFAVLGVAQKIDSEILIENCRNDGVPIVRRCSAGGAVVQGPGCLNFSLVLDMERTQALRPIRASFHHILHGIVQGLRIKDPSTAIAGVSDLVIGRRKFSGNAQRRKRRALLHHGTLLYKFSIDRMARYLKEPGKRPDYREERSHGNFVTNFALPREDLMEIVKEVFAPDDSVFALGDEERSKVVELARAKYARGEWTYKL